MQCIERHDNRIAHSRHLGIVRSIALALLFVMLLWLLVARALPSEAAGQVINCNDAGLTQALGGGGAVTFNCNGANAPATLVLGTTKVITQNTTIDGGNVITLSGGGTTRLFQVNAGAALTLTHITLQDGSTPGDNGGAVKVASGAALTVLSSRFYSNTAGAPWSGGAVESFGTLNISSSEFAYNAAGNGGVLFPRESTSLTTISSSSFHDNQTTNTTNGFGGAILLWNGAQMSIDDSTTFLNNTARTGGALYVFSVSVLTLTSAYVAHNHALNADGGGLWNNGTTYVRGSTFLSNTADAGWGGGVYNQDFLEVTASTLDGNHAVQGGGVYNQGYLQLTTSTLDSNHSDQGGGGMVNAGTAYLDRSTLRGNAADQGGGIYNSAVMLDRILGLADSTLSGNSARFGGGIYQYTGTATLNSSTLSGNWASIGGGGLYSADGRVTIGVSSLDHNTAQDGGGIFNDATLALIASTLSGNSANEGGGIENITNGTATLNNSTLSGNTVTQDGGGVSNFGRMTFYNVTLAYNGALSGGALFMDLGHTTILTNTILAYSPAGGNCAGTITSSKFTLSSDNSCALPAGNTIKGNNPNNLDPLLDALGNYGGPTTGVEHSPLLTHMIKVNSPAKDGVVGNDAPLSDERGLPRPGPDGSFDIGAVERQDSDGDAIPRLWLPLIVR